MTPGEAKRQLSSSLTCKALYALCRGLNCFQFKKFRAARSSRRAPSCYPRGGVFRLGRSLHESCISVSGTVRCSFTKSLSTPKARLVGLFVLALLLVFAAAMIVGHWRERAVYGQLAEHYPVPSDQSVTEHRSVRKQSN
jgi:hypothetical protein